MIKKLMTTASRRVLRCNIGDEPQVRRSRTSNAASCSLSVKPRISFGFLKEIPSLYAGKGFIILIISLYQATLSKLSSLIFGNVCCFQPSCSEYSKTAIKRYGIVDGGVLSLRRVLKCHPLTNTYFDPVP